jgi:predicted PurR-regulated permease PerM
VLVTGGVALVGIAALELSIREHFSGYRSHSGLLAAVVAVGLMAGLALAGLPQVAAIAVGVVAGVLSFVALRRTFQSKSGGLAWRA